MSIQDLRERLEKDGWPRSTPSPDSLHTVARSVSARRRFAVASAGLGTAAVVLAAAAFAVAAGSETGRPPVASSSDREADTPPGLADGYKYFAVDSVLTQVPEALSVGDERCGTPMSDTVVFGSSPRECAVAQPPVVTAVRVVTGELPRFDETDSWVEQATRQASSAGVQYLTSEIQESGGEFSASIVVTDDATVLHISSPSHEVVERFVSSVEAVPADMVAIPWTGGMTGETASARLGTLGLATSLVQDEAEDVSPEYVTKTEPVAGTVVADGDDVIIFVARAR